MRQPGILKPNDDPEMQPFVIQNHGPHPVKFTSILEVARPDLEEHPEDKEIWCHVGKRAIIPHGYFKVDVLGPGAVKVDYHFGDRAPELKNYRKGYRMKMLRKPWYKRLSDMIFRD